MNRRDRDHRITAVLGPTNTGKTHLAIERMLGHATGMIGFPLRLLARENYDRIVGVKGRGAVALVTGEERIVPPNARWFVSTVEAMPLDRSVGFLAVDEIQLATDPERGHIFTQRLLQARGRDETMFMGSDTVRGVLKRLVPEAEIIARPRFSTLSYTGPRKVTRLPPRTAVVAFSVPDVFELAELVRRQRGGTAVVMGALSPRARNAQVALYQSGEVDYLVATDAIGMGLNMDLDHVAFARLAKFDGKGPRRLSAPEIAQIAGRAGRHLSDGSFGTTAEAGPLDPDLVDAVESHRFDPATALWWRNDALSFRSGADLLRSLDAPPPHPLLIRAPEADDHLALQALLRQDEIRRSATGPAAVRLLWEVCRIPDFRKVMSEHHARLLGQIYRHLTSPTERLPADWVDSQIRKLDRTDGEIDSLVARIAHIRTWTYITHREGWIDQGAHWQERARAIEDRLSDALHDRITQRFVDRRSALLIRHLGEARHLAAAVTAEGELRVEGHYVGELKGFQFQADPAAAGEAARPLLVAANRVLPGEIQARARRLVAEPDPAFTLTDRAMILWAGAEIARLAPGETVLAPRIEVLPADFLEGDARERVRRRLDQWLRSLIADRLASLIRLGSLALEAAGRGLAYRLAEGLGAIDAGGALGLVQALSSGDRRQLGRAGVRFGTETIYLAPLLKPAAVALRGLLWAVFAGAPEAPVALPLPLPAPSALSVPVGFLGDPAYAAAIGFRCLGPRAVRLDRADSLAAALRSRARAGAFPLDGALASLIGAPLADLAGVVTALGYRGRMAGETVLFTPLPRRARQDRGVAAGPATPATVLPAGHPFAALAAIDWGAP